MKLALEIINREIAQKELANKHDHLRKEICTKEIEELKQVVNLLSIQNVIWRCNEDITDLYGNVMFTKGLIYEQVKADQYPMMLIDNNVEESEVYNLKDSFTSI